MKIEKISSALLSTAIAAAGFMHTAQAADKASTEPHTGKASVVLKFVNGVNKNGTPDKAHDAACKTQLSDINSKFLGVTVNTKYSINTQSLMMSAESSFPSPHSTQPLELTVKMNPLGISGSYSFGAFLPAELPNAYVLFSISEKFIDAKSTFLVINEGKNYNCLISSAPNAFKSAESARFGTEEPIK